MDIDKNHIWHPYTGLTDPLPVYEVERADGIHITLKNGTRLIDGMSSWWACVYGYNHPALNAAAQAQIEKTSHIMFGGFIHEPAVKLTEKLLEITPEGLDTVFYSDSGSVAVEVAMKMAVQYWAVQDKPNKSKFLTARFGYHGDTTAAMSVCDPISGMHSLFSDFIPKHIFGPAIPLGYDSALEEHVIQEFELLFEKHHSELAAFIIEPVVQGAGGMRMYNPTYLKEIKQLCEKYHVLFIADEIATGFGRTGKKFGVSHADVTPDIMCLGKALSGGFMTFAATLSTREIADTISNHPPNVFMHGPTFMANPLACAVSLASINLLEKTDYLTKVAQIENWLKQFLTNIPEAKDIRILGAVGVVEFEQQIDVAEAQKLFVELGVWIRPFRNLAYIMPPYIIEETELKTLCTAIKEMAKTSRCFLD